MEMKRLLPGVARPWFWDCTPGQHFKTVTDTQQIYREALASGSHPQIPLTPPEGRTLGLH